MSTHIPQRLSAALRDYQRQAIVEMTKYVERFDATQPKAGLVQMPTGSGKTGVIAALARCETRRGPVVIIAPRIGIRDQLARYVDKRFFEHAGVDPASLPRRVFELRDGNDDPGDLDDVVIITTVQLLTSMEKKSKTLSADLRRRAVLVLFDEGHYEPAVVWSQVVRNLPCPRVIFTATAFRDDFKTFDIDPDHTYRYSFDQARRERYIRDVKLHKYAPERSPAAFADQVLEAYDRLFSSPNDNDADRPRAIIRCDTPEEIRQILRAISQRARSVIGIHETFGDDPQSGEYHRVPNPDRVDATFWIHQFKLLEGIDDHRFQMLALYSELRSVRSFVQQVGRVIRNPRRTKNATAHVLDHSARGRQTVLWNEFLQYDKLLEQGDPLALDLNQRSLVESLQQAVPGLLYVDGRFRVPADVGEMTLDDLQLPLSANVVHKPKSLSMPEVTDAIVRQCEEQDLFFQVLDSPTDTVAVLHVRVGVSPFLEGAFFPEPKLGITLVHLRGKYVFVFETGGALGTSAVNGRPVAGSRLRKLFVKGPDAKLTQVSMLNSNLGADQVRTRAFSAVSVDALAPSFDEHGYVLTTATGYSRGRRGDKAGEESKVRRYVGVGNGRISDYGGGFVPLDVWKTWTEGVKQLLDRTGPSLPVFSRWADQTKWPKDPTPRNVLLDISEVVDQYRTTGDDDLAEGVPMELGELCADVENGAFSITANGKIAEVEIQVDPKAGKYVLKSPELDARYYSIDPEMSEGLIRYLNRTQSFRVIPATTGFFYTVGQFCRPLIRFGPDYDDSKMGVLGSLYPIPALRNVTLEKGQRSRRNGAGWERGSLFDMIDSLGAGSELAPHLDGTEVLVCDDLRDESADFIATTHPRRVIFIHAKAKAEASNCSGSALQDVCGQAQKNLREVSLFAEPGPSKQGKWGEPWEGRPHTVGQVTRRIRIRVQNSHPEEDIRRVIKDPNADREVWLVLGNLLSKAALEEFLLTPTPPAYAIQAAYLLFSTITNTAAAAARLRVFCAP